ncbi:MAG: TonB-dependent receptor [Bacteroidia bacterium]|nr:TonB-dependent receptor [Bacteroidia bacterium]
MTKNLICLLTLTIALQLHSIGQNQSLGKKNQNDTTKQYELKEYVITASKISERVFLSPLSIIQLKSADLKNLSSISNFDAIENLKGVHVITPSLGFKVINTRGFSNTTNVRFAQLIDGIDNQAPHIGAPIANALGANDIDIEKIEIISGTASALYGMNSINGLANIITKNPFYNIGLSIQQVVGLNHVGNNTDVSAKINSHTNIRFADTITSKTAYKINISYFSGFDWIANNRTDLAKNQNISTNLTGYNNPAYDEINSYGNESPNRRTLTLNGKKYVVARTGYRESDIANYNIENYKGDFGLFFKPKKGQSLSFTYKGALINTIYQRSNRFCLKDYKLHQFAFDFNSNVIQLKNYITIENTGKSYNLRSLAENIDRAFKSDNEWFSDYSKTYNKAISEGIKIDDAHKQARKYADSGRFEPKSEQYDNKFNELVNINNWDIGAALRVKSFMLHSEGLLNWNKIYQSFFDKLKIQILSGYDYRDYIIVPDGNYFINPETSSSKKNINYMKLGGFTQINKELFKNKIKLGLTLRADKSDYFNLKFNPRFTMVYSPIEKLILRIAYQSGYRFPSIFEGFSNVNSGGVKRVGGLKIMSNGIFENSYTKKSIDDFQTKVNSDINNLGYSQTMAIEKNKDIIKKNPYTYLQPEFVKSTEIGIRTINFKRKIYIDADIYYNIYENFIAQVEANIPSTEIIDSIPYYLYSKSKQNRFRLWTNSKSKIYNLGASIGMKLKLNNIISILTNATYSKLYKTEDKDGLEDGFNTPEWIINNSLIFENIKKKLGFGFTHRYQTKYEYVSFLVNGYVPQFHTFDAQFNYNFSKTGIVAKIGATNLFNKSYYSILGGPSIGVMYFVSISYNMK